MGGKKAQLQKGLSWLAAGMPETYSLFWNLRPYDANSRNSLLLCQCDYQSSRCAEQDPHFIEQYLETD
ncbi:hypothetical protein GRJ2_002712200 [Grus japonensis]|uniref:Uncharacterized protein n=1 Tax=Grus japonensis TaxID=30415 RepID=A0ABC9XXT7_GRUJA